jgi:hypothetical protein
MQICANDLSGNKRYEVILEHEVTDTDLNEQPGAGKFLTGANRGNGERRAGEFRGRKKIVNLGLPRMGSVGLG